jgi:flagellar biosynthetic protein FliR
MQPVLIDASDLSAWVTRLWWPVLRVGGFVAAAPVVNHPGVPARAKVALTVALAFLLAPLAHVPPALSIFSGAGVLAALHEVLIGVAIGLIVQVAFEALEFAGQSVSNSMGLGFATLIDPQHGASTPVLGQLFTIVGMLTYLAIDGHLTLLGALAHSFDTLPVGAPTVDRGLFFTMAGWGARIFESGLLIALPALIALVIVNVAIGVISRAAPQLNLFGIGFTVALLGGFFVLLAGLDGLAAGISGLLDEALSMARALAPEAVH